MESIKSVLEYIVLIGAVFGGFAAIVVGIKKLFLPFDKLDKLENENKELKAHMQNKEKELVERHDRDIKGIKDEQSVIIYALLASLKDDEESKAKAIDMLEKHLNKAAHEHGGDF